MFASDRDLVIAEPGLLGEVGWLGQEVARSTVAAIDSSGLLLTAADGAFTSAGIGAGYVAQVDRTTYEVISVSGATLMLISKIRASESELPIPGTPGSGLALGVMTFRPQIEMVHRQVMRMGGIEVDGTEGEGVVTESAILNGDDLRALEVFGALHLVFAAASAGGMQGNASQEKASAYRDRFEQERRRVGIRVDLDGDGIGDAVRRLTVFRFARA